MAQKVRAEAVYSGEVQGVGFRFTARRVASRYGIAGFVQNLDDGTVRLVAEGDKPEVEAFLRDISNAMDAYILNKEVAWAPAAGDLVGFTVRF